MTAELAPGTRGVTWSTIHVASDDLIVVEASMRLYVARSRDGSYLHVVSPSQVDAIDSDGNVIRPAGTLACTCKGFVFHGSCYRATQAIAFEEDRDVESVAWLPEASRG